MKKITLKSMILTLFCFPVLLFAQEKHEAPKKHFNQELTEANQKSLEETGFVKCETVEYEAYLQNKFPKRATTDEFENWLAPKAQLIQQQIQSGNYRGGVNMIPVIFHVITDGAGGDNLSQAAIQAQLDQLNIDYANLAGSTYAAAADTQIQFCLAQMNVSGTQLSEPGINRVTAYGGGPFSTGQIESTIKAATQWDPEQYMNVWTANISGGILGYAQFPSNSGLTGLDPDGGAANTDGVVIAANSVGSIANPNPLGAPYNKGRTLSHEAGHWLGLRHTWGDNWAQGQPNNASCGVDDFCADTPNSGRPNFGCPTGIDTCPTTGIDMIENYMDYTDDSCMNTFTANQVTRILAVMANSPRRVNLLTSSVCNTSPTVSVASSLPPVVTEGSDCGYQDIEITLALSMGASASATATLVHSGTATQNADFALINNSVTFAAGSTTASNTVTLRVYEDGITEADETIVLNVNVSTSGDATATGATYTVTITNDDNAVVSSGNAVLFSDGFETYPDFTITPVGGWTMLDNDGDTTFAADGNDFPNEGYIGSFIVFNPSQGTPPFTAGWNAHTGNKGYYCFNSTGNNSGTPLNDDYIFTPQISLNGTNSELKFWAKSLTTNYNGGERFKVGISTTNTSPGSFIYITASPYVIPPLAWTEYTFDLSAYDGQNIYITFHVVSSDEFVFMLDDVSVTANVTTTVQTEVNTATSTSINDLGVAYISDSSTGNIMTSIDNTSGFNYGCTDVSVSRDIATAGAAAVMYGSNTDPAGFVTAKTFDIATATTNTSDASSIGFYFTEAELVGWETITGNLRSSLYAKKEGTNEIVSMNITAFGSDSKLTGAFTTGLTGTYVFGTQMALLSVNSFELNSEISLYPNPTSHVLNIKSTNKNLPDNYAVYNMLGQIVLSNKITTESDLSINTSSLSNGMYFIKISKESNQISLPFIKK